jgi:hypothetical protein
VADQIRLEGVKETLKLLDAVQPGSIKELRKDIKRITLPAVTAIKSRIPSVAPTSGMSHYGRTKYGGGKVRAELKTTDSKFSNTSSLITLVAESSDKNAAGFDIADMAGRRTMFHGPRVPYQYKGTGRRGGSGRQRPTKSRGIVRRGQVKEFSYTITGQGKGLTDELGGTPSRYVYPAVTVTISGIRDDMAKTLDAYVGRINQKLKVR